MPGAVPPRGRAEGRLEGAGERGLGLVARGQGDGQHRQARAPELVGRPFQAQAPDMRLNRFPDHAGEDPVEMVRRKAGHRRQILQAQGRVQMALQMHEDPQQALFVVPLRGGAKASVRRHHAATGITERGRLRLTIFADLLQRQMDVREQFRLRGGVGAVHIHLDHGAGAAAAAARGQPVPEQP